MYYKICFFVLLSFLGAAVYADSDFELASSSIGEAYFKHNVQVLASDEFEGREPDTPGEQKTIHFLAEQLKKAGIEPGNKGSYFQQVPLLAIDSKVIQPLKLGDEQLTHLLDYVATTEKAEKTITLKDSELVFVGYGIVAPEYDWNDYKDIDVKGKTVVILINDPGFRLQDERYFKGKAMTYYGRWTYKYEEAARQGAAAAIIIHQTAPASYNWGVVANSWSDWRYRLGNENNRPKIDVGIWISEEKANALFERSELDFQALQEQALSNKFRAISLKQNASLVLSNDIKHSNSSNVIGTIKGSEKPDEHIVYIAHWDHLGKKTHLDQKDQIFNGALDNASGSAAMLSIAQAFMGLKDKPKRSITFLFVTAEEQGLLGSEYYASHPVVATNKTVGAFNIDSMNIAGRMKNLTVIGLGQSSLDEYMVRAAKRQQRAIVKEAHPEKGGFYRSDHFSLSKRGVPAIFLGSGLELDEGEDVQLYKKLRQSYADCYHQVCDEVRADWVWDAALEDIKVLFDAGYQLANTSDWPHWNEGSEFKSIREQDLNYLTNSK